MRVWERERDVNERVVEWLRRVVNVKVALVLMQIKTRWLIPFDPPVHSVNAAICWEVLTPIIQFVKMNERTDTLQSPSSHVSAAIPPKIKQKT